MASILVTAQVEDGAEWEAKFRSHGDLFSSFGVQSPVRFGVVGNSIAVVTDVDDAVGFDADAEAVPVPELVGGGGGVFEDGPGVDVGAFEGGEAQAAIAGIVGMHEHDRVGKRVL